MPDSKVAVVGHCASGKSSVVQHLKAQGIDAWSVAQEHSIVRDLWNHQRPDHLVFLHVGLDQVRIRRHNPAWPEWIYDEQERRLATARSHASLIVDTDELNVEQVAQQVVAFLS